MKKNQILILISEINDEIEKITENVSQIEESLNIIDLENPKPIEVSGMAAFIHSFYSGLERIMLLIAKEVDRDIPTGVSWHRDLLLRMGINLKNIRPAVFSKDSIKLLDTYAGFRHVFRHAYSAELQWSRIRQIAQELQSHSCKFKKEIEKFLHFLQALE